MLIHKGLSRLFRWLNKWPCNPFRTLLLWDMLPCGITAYLSRWGFFISLLKHVRRKKEIYSHLNDFTDIKLLSSDTQAAITRLKFSFASRFSKCKPSQLWNNIGSLVLIQTKCSTPKCWWPHSFMTSFNSDILQLLYRIKSNSTESSLIIPHFVLKMY